MLLSVEDSKYIKSRFFIIKTESKPYIIKKAVRVNDRDDVLKTILMFMVTNYPELSLEDAEALINDDKTVNLDFEGIAYDASDDTIWIASEGRGTVGDDSRPIEHYNMILHVNTNGKILEVIPLTAELNLMQVRYGLEGVAVQGNMLVAVIQRSWEDNGKAHVLRFNKTTREWEVFYYELTTPESQNGGWVGLSDITPLPTPGQFMVIERDNQGGPDAAIKKLQKIDLTTAVNGIVEKLDSYDLIPFYEGFGGLVVEKVEGLSYDTVNGGFYIVNDNDGLDDNNGETILAYFEV